MTPARLEVSASPPSAPLKRSRAITPPILGNAVTANFYDERWLELIFDAQSKTWPPITGMSRNIDPHVTEFVLNQIFAIDQYARNTKPSCGEKQMTTASKLLMTSAVALSLATPVMAQEDNTLAERNVYLFMNGHMIQTHVTSDAMHATIMKNFKPLKNGTMIYVNGGKLYIGEDRKMHGGQMMSTEIFGRDLGIGRER